MFVDAELLLCDGQHVNDVGAGTTDYSDNAINLSVARNIAKGKPLYVVIIVDEGVVGSTSCTITISVITATNYNLTTNQKVLIATPAIAEASLTAGRTPIVLALPPLPESGGSQQYLGLKFVSTYYTSAGHVTAFLAVDADTNF